MVLGQIANSVSVVGGLVCANLSVKPEGVIKIVAAELLLPNYLSINSRGFIWTNEENIASLKSGVVFSSIEIKAPKVIKISPASAVIVAHVFTEVAVGGQNLSTATLTSTVWVKQDDKWLVQLHTSTAAAQG